MTDGTRRVYRTPPSSYRRLFVMSVIPLALTSIPLITAFGLGPVTKAALIAPYFVLFALPFGWLQRSATIVDEEYVTLRGLRARRIAWSQVQGIETEVRVVTRPDGGRPLEGVVIQVGDGRRRRLPHLHEANVPALRREVEALRELWTRGRGAGWTPEPAIAEPEPVAGAPNMTVLGPVIALLIAMASFIVCAGLALVLLVTGVLKDAGGGTLNAIMFGPAVLVFVVALGVIKVRQRRPRG